MSLDPVSVRMLSQHLCSPKFRTPEEVVSHFGAMQAQEYRMMRWAVSMRTVRPSEKAFRQAYDEGRIIRLHLHRGTWQLVTRDDYWWMLRLCGPRSEAAIRGWMHSNRIDIPEDELMNIRELLVAEAGRGCSVTKEDFVRALAGQGITMDDHRLSYHIRMAELSGTLCSGDLHPRKATYSLVRAKIGPEPVLPDRDDALALLARKPSRTSSGGPGWESPTAVGQWPCWEANCIRKAFPGEPFIFTQTAVPGASGRAGLSSCLRTTSISSATRAAMSYWIRTRATGPTTVRDYSFRSSSRMAGCAATGIPLSLGSCIRR